MHHKFFIPLLVLLQLVFVSSIEQNNDGLNRKLKYKIHDSHLHYLNFIQNTDGMEKLVEKMKTAGVEKAVIFGMPLQKVNDGYPLSNLDEYHRADYYLDTDSRVYYYPATDELLMLDLIDYAKKYPEESKMFYPTICGINPTDKNSAARVKNLIELSKKIGFKWYGFGELMSHHGELTAMTYGEPPTADHPAMNEIFNLAAKEKIPVLLHHDISSANVKSPLYLKELLRSITAHPDTTFIWAHLGINRRVDVPELDKYLANAFDKCPNLYMDISWVVLEDYLEKSDIWVDFLNKYQDRILVGSDKVATWDTYIDEMARYEKLFDKLSESTRKKIGYENFEKLYGPEGGYYTRPSF